MMTRVVVLLLISAVTASGQALNSGSNGSDGALNLTAPGEVIFDPVALGIDADRDNVFHFTTITIGPDVIVKMPFNALQGAPVVWLATGAVQIDGTIDLDGQPGADASPGLLNRTSVPGPGGYPGGAGSNGIPGSSIPLAGLGPGAGQGSFTGVGRHAAHAFSISGSAASGPVYGSAVLVPLRGGSGGGGSGTFSEPGGSGGAGGGALQIIGSLSIAVNGVLTADGGNGGAGAGGGSGGSGGGVHLIAPTITGSGKISANGGLHGGSPGFGRASVGRIRLDASAQQFAGTAGGMMTQGTPYNVPLPAAYPTVRVTSIANIPVSATPTGEPATPDVSLDEDGPVTVTSDMGRWTSRGAPTSTRPGEEW